MSKYQTLEELQETLARTKLLESLDKILSGKKKIKLMPRATNSSVLYGFTVEII